MVEDAGRKSPAGWVVPVPRGGLQSSVHWSWAGLGFPVEGSDMERLGRVLPVFEVPMPAASPELPRWGCWRGSVILTLGQVAWQH